VSQRGTLKFVLSHPLRKEHEKDGAPHILLRVALRYFNLRSEMNSLRASQELTVFTALL
jgi:hypothetical protein